jgi:23S rRNA pseudouridine2604 synthase
MPIFAENSAVDNSISLNKYISDTGYCSRREADRLIEAGRVLLNDRPVHKGSRFKPGDQVEVDGSILKPAKKEKAVYIAFNKPVGITTTTDTDIRGNIISYMNYPKRIFPIGRLDKDSDGLIFMTNDGDIVNKVLRAGNKHEKEYIVRVNKPVDPAFIHGMSTGVKLDRETTLPCKISAMGRQTFRIVLTQGLNRQIRRMCEHFDYKVESLTRTRIMNIKLDKLAPGRWRYLSEPEINQLMESISDSTGTEEGSFVINLKSGASKKSAEKNSGIFIDGEDKKSGNRRSSKSSTTQESSSEKTSGRKSSHGKSAEKTASKKSSEGKTLGNNSAETKQPREKKTITLQKFDPDTIDQREKKKNKSYKEFRKKGKSY